MADEALSFFIDTDMTTQSYQKVRSAAKGKKADIYPPYNKIRSKKARGFCKCTSTKSAGMDHTALRIIQEQKESINEVVQNLPESQELSCKLICKWGFDGASGQSEYKQKFSSTDKTDESLFCTTLVLLQMVFEDRILWQN